MVDVTSWDSGRESSCILQPTPQLRVPPLLGTRGREELGGYGSATAHKCTIQVVAIEVNHVLPQTGTAMNDSASASIAMYGYAEPIQMHTNVRQLCCIRQ